MKNFVKSFLIIFGRKGKVAIAGILSIILVRRLGLPPDEAALYVKAIYTFGLAYIGTTFGEDVVKHIRGNGGPPEKKE